MADTSSSSESDSFDVTIDDTSPTIVYSPFADSFGNTSLPGGWNPCYSLTGAPVCDSSIGQDNSTATSLHVATEDNASLTIRWNGTAVTLYGYFPVNNPSFPSALSYSISLDGIPTTNYVSNLLSGNISQDILASFTNLTNAEHTVQLTMHNSQGLSNSSAQLLFDRAVIISLPPSSNLQSNSAVATQVFPDNAISFHGEWSFSQDVLPGENTPFHTSTNVGDSASLTFNGTAITLSGLTTPLSGAYNVTLDNESPQTLSARASLNASTVLFFQTGLDPTVTHHLTIANIGASAEGEGTLLAVGSVNVTYVAQNGGGATPTAVMSSSPLSHGAIAGISVAAAIVATIFIAAIGYLVHRRRQTARRKEQLIVNPRMSVFRRLSFLPGSRQSRQVDVEKEQESRAHDARYSNPILEIGERKEAGSEEGTEEHGRGEHDVSPAGANSRHASQNSDGSYAISLPELPAKGKAREEITPPLVRPVVSVVSRISQMSQRTPVPQSPSPRSPRPRGPRDMHHSSLPHIRNSSQGILLKEMYTPTADVPVDVQEIDAETLMSNDRTFLPAPTVSPLRVNFEQELADQAERKKEGRVKSGVSGISLPQSLRQAFSWGHDTNRQSISQMTIPDTPRQRDARYSFLDMESTRSNSISGGTRSTHPSRTTSTRSSSKSQRYADDSEWSAPGKSAPPLPHRSSMGFSMIMAGGPTASQPSLSPNISLQAVPLPHVILSDESNMQSPQDVPLSAHPHELSEFLPSPTESIPMTVSDIHFRHSSQSSTSASGAPRPSDESGDRDTRPATHLSLPAPATQSARPHDRPYIVQKLLGRHGADSGPSTPFSSPTRHSFRPFGPRTSVRRGPWIGPSFSSAMNTPKPS